MELGAFSYNLGEHRIFISRRFFNEFGATGSYSPQDQEKFARHQFYLYPAPTVTRADLASAIAAKMPVQGADGRQLYRTTLRVTLVTDGLRDAAAAAFNHAIPQQEWIGVISHFFPTGI